MPRTQFENLEVYKLSENLADCVCGLVASWESFAKLSLGSQLVRAADSVGCNIAEGAGRGSFKDNRRFVRTARGSLNETKHLLRRAYKRGLLAETNVAELRPPMDELAPRLNAYLRSIGPRKQTATDDRPRTTDT